MHFFVSYIRLLWTVRGQKKHEKEVFVQANIEINFRGEGSRTDPPNYRAHLIVVDDKGRRGVFECCFCPAIPSAENKDWWSMTVYGDRARVLFSTESSGRTNARFAPGAPGREQVIRQVQGALSKAMAAAYSSLILPEDQFNQVYQYSGR